GVYRYDGTYFGRFLNNDGIINKNGLDLKHVSSALQDKNGNIWFATWFEGICRYDGKSVTNFKPNGEKWFSGVLEDKSGNIWVGRRDKGVCRYDGSAFANVLQKGMFDSCGVGPMAEDKAGNIWFCAEAGDITKRETTGGVWCYNPSAPAGGSAVFTNFTTKEGLSNNSVFSVTPDKSGKLWFGTRGMGLCSYDGKSFTNFSE
ncbi:MAG: two-component regulator propeller domain-containing protein, partial [Bacteroidota bacterium]